MGDKKKLTFKSIQGKEISVFTAPSCQELFQKWGMNHMNMQLYSYSNYFEIQEKEDFVKAFFKDSSVQSTLKSFSSLNTLIPIGNLNIKYALVTAVPTNITNMSFFDRLYTSSLVRECGSITKCFDEMVGDILVSDELRKMLLSDESNYADLYSAKEQSEFIYCLFKHIVLGGYCCQYEDNIKNYIDITKLLYKDLLYVRKDAKTSALIVETIVLKVQLYNLTDDYVFPGKLDNEQNFCYMIINPEKRNLLVWHHRWNDP